MQFKLKPTEIYGLLDMISYVLLEYPHARRSEQILYLVIDGIRIKLRAKLEQREQKQYHSLTLTHLEAISFEEWADKILTKLPADYYDCERNLTLQMTTQINQKYAHRLNKPQYAVGEVRRIS